MAKDMDASFGPDSTDWTKETLLKCGGYPVAFACPSAEFIRKDMESMQAELCESPEPEHLQ